MYTLSFQWLSIGAGYGDMEKRILQSLPNMKIDRMECYEPGNEQFKNLKQVDFGLVNKTILHNEAFDESTELGNITKISAGQTDFSIQVIILMQ